MHLVIDSLVRCKNCESNPAGQRRRSGGAATEAQRTHSTGTNGILRLWVHMVSIQFIHCGSQHGWVPWYPPPMAICPPLHSAQQVWHGFPQQRSETMQGQEPLATGWRQTHAAAIVRQAALHVVDPNVVGVPLPCRSERDRPTTLHTKGHSTRCHCTPATDWCMCACSQHLHPTWCAHCAHPAGCQALQVTAVHVAQRVI